MLPMPQAPRVPPSLLVLCAGGALLLAPAADAQIVPKAPPAPTPTPAYTPPPAPPPVPTKPPEPEVAVPDLVKRDAAGGFLPITGSVELAAIRALELDADRRQRVDAALDTRNAELEKFAIENIEKVAAAHQTREGLKNVTDFAQLASAKDAATPLRQDKLLDRLQRDGAINAMHRSALDRAIARYNEARQRDWETQTGTDVMKIATRVGQQGFTDMTGDVFAALDRLLERAAPSLLNGEHRLTLDKAQEDAVVRLKPVLQTPRFQDNAEIMEQLRTFALKTLAPEQARQLLAPVATPIGR